MKDHIDHVSDGDDNDDIIISCWIMNNDVKKDYDE